MNEERDIHYMQLALEQARAAGLRGEVPIGAAVVYDPVDPATRKCILPEPRLVSVAGNRRECDADPAGHAEFLAMKEAAARLGRWRLTGCTVYVTLEPCIMCAGLMHQARVDACVFGARDMKAGALGTLYSIHDDARLNHSFKVAGGVLGEECEALLKGFFAAQRAGKDASAGAPAAPKPTPQQLAEEALAALDAFEDRAGVLGDACAHTSEPFEGRC